MVADHGAAGAVRLELDIVNDIAVFKDVQRPRSSRSFVNSWSMVKLRKLAKRAGSSN